MYVVLSIYGASDDLSQDMLGKWKFEMRMLLRFVSLVSLIAAVVAGVADTVQSFAADVPVMTPGLTLMQFALPGVYERMEGYVATLPSGARLARWLDLAMSQPAFAILLALSLLFWIVAYRKPKPAGRFAA